MPLVAVELSFDGDFELTNNDADILIQISGGAILWQKERLLNLAIKSVPPEADSIAWIDCDVVFERTDWVADAKQQLTSANVIQLFADTIDLGAEDHKANSDYRYAAPTGRGVLKSIDENSFKDFTLTPGGNKRSFAWGLAWAARREILEDHGLYDAMIVGGGPRALVSAIYGNFDKVVDAYQLNSARREHYLMWARPYQRAVDARVGYVAGRLYHLWHGDVENRNYAGRHRGLVEFEPDADLVVGANGAWHWARSRPSLQKFLEDFFVNRAEDG